MTTREAFEEWVKKNHPFGNLVGGADATERFPDYWAAWQAATAAALERAAVACESLGMTTSGIYERNHECASAIRALKDET